MQTQRLNITLPNALARELRGTISIRSRSKFIAAAIEEKLLKKDLKKQLRQSAQAQKEIIERMQEDFKVADEESFSKIP